ncbi:MAG: class I SAM-dependent methyltransferase [Candidatus Bathyarchaeota archaeon]|nr:class I SAM-dependent methyltransferase [Candidatus Bathyarchaeota archaeon]
MEFSNVYEDAKRAEAYSKLEFPGTYYLAYRDLPEIIHTHVKGRKAIDFGCGTGRSTRFLKRFGFSVVGVDIAQDMVKKARELDPEGDYRVIREADFRQFARGAFDLVLSVFTFDNVPTMERKVQNFKGLGILLKDSGRLVSVVSSPEIYTHEWASFSTKDFPENKHAKSGDNVRIVQTDIEDKRPVVDVLWTDKSYREAFKKAGLKVVRTYKPWAKESEPYKWVNETWIAPWVIYVLKKCNKLEFVNNAVEAPIKRN